MAKYSIILPVKNGGDYVKECVKSILLQTVDDFRLQVLDSYSTDGTLDWLESLHDKRIEIYRTGKPLSIEENWARIKSISKGEFMTMIGYDDLLYPDYLEEINTLITRHPGATLYHTHFVYVDKNGEFIRHCLPMCEEQRAFEFLSCQMNRTIDSTGTGYVMRSMTFDSVGGMPAHYPNLIFSDFELWIRSMSKGYKATSFRECFSYRLHDSVSKVTNGMQYQQAFQYYMAFVKELMKEDTMVKEVVTRYGAEMLLYFCESLSHRLLKTPLSQRTLRVSDFIKICEALANDMIPGQPFRPMGKARIRIAKRLDSSLLGRSIFKVYKKFGN